MPNLLEHRFRHFLCSLKWKGIETQTETGPLFIIAGVKAHCIAASVAG